jgi:Ran GTPase-activating protein (RanGAP) involved in mRNA processing and transport
MGLPPACLVDIDVARVGLTDGMLPRIRGLALRLRRLSLRANAITDAGVPMLLDLLAGAAATLRVLDLSRNQFTPVGIAVIENVVLHEWFGLRSLTLQDGVSTAQNAVDQRAAHHDYNAALPADALDEVTNSLHTMTHIDLSRAFALPSVNVDISGGAWQLLHTVTLANCALTSLAPLAGALASCVALESLCLMNNALCDLPHGVSAMLGSARALTSLDLSFNAFTTLPVGVRDATALQRLSLRSNRLDTLPLFHSDVALRTLDLSSNQLSEWPAALDDTLLRECRTLRLAHNRLTLVPSLMLGKLKHLEYLSLFGNPMINHDATHESDELLASMRALQAPASSARAVRVLVLGKERVGKTS